MECITFDRYIAAFHLLEKYSEEYPFMLRHLTRTIREEFPDGCSMLDIGAGTGQFARSFLAESGGRIRDYTGIEPSDDHVPRLVENLRGSPCDTLVRQDYFTPRTEPGRRFDLILLSHSTYCFLPDPEPYLLHALSLLNQGGKAIIYNGSPANFCYLLNLLHRDILPRERITNPFFTSWEIRDILEKNRISHTSEFLPGYLKAGPFFQPENRTMLDELITFSLMVEADSLGPGVLERSREFLRTIAYPSDQGLCLNLGVDAITVSPDDPHG